MHVPQVWCDGESSFYIVPKFGIGGTKHGLNDCWLVPCLSLLCYKHLVKAGSISISKRPGLTLAAVCGSIGIKGIQSSQRLNIFDGTLHKLEPVPMHARIKPDETPLAPDQRWQYVPGCHSQSCYCYRNHILQFTPTPFVSLLNPDEKLSRIQTCIITNPKYH